MARKKVVVEEVPKEFVPCENCNGVGVNVAVDERRYCDVCNGSGQVEK